MRTSAIIILVLSAFSCTRDRGQPVDLRPTPLELNVPKLFPQPYLSAENPLTKEGVFLGRNLYHDAILSSNGLSCSSCHIADYSFSSPLFITQDGEHKSVPPHVNLAWNPEYNWNGSEHKLDLLALGDFGPEFFNTDMNELVKKLKAHPEYPLMFQKAFGITDVGKLSHEELQVKIVYAISQFLRTMISGNSRFDQWLRHEIILTPEEFNGFEIFYSEKGDCFHCHGYPLMTSNAFSNNGLDKDPQGPNLGHYLVTGKNTDKGKFSVPTLRNVELTAPYMHDGRFQTLEEVIEFYDSGVHWDSPNIDPLMTKPFKQYGLYLSPNQKRDLVTFLKTLTDTAFVNNKDFRRPW